MGKNKGASKAEVGAKAATKTEVVNGANPATLNGRSNTKAYDTAPATTAANARTTPIDVDLDSPTMQTNTGMTERTARELPVPIHRIPGLYFETGDVQILVAETHEAMLHQEILASHSTFFSEQLQFAGGSKGLVVAPRSSDIPVIILRDISVAAFVNALRIIYPLPTAIQQPRLTPSEAEQLLQTSSMLGMMGISNFAMDVLSIAPGATDFTIYCLSQQFSLPRWKVKSMQGLVYRIRPLSNNEAQIVGALATAQIARLRETFRSRIFARFEPVVKEETSLDAQPHQYSQGSEQLWRTEGRGRDLGRCQQAMLNALKVVFDVDRPQSEASVMTCLTDYLQQSPGEGSIHLCKGCLESVEKVVGIYCKKEEMDETVEQEVYSGGALGSRI